MAVLNGILRKLNGSAGSLTFKQVNGQTVVSEKITSTKKTNTPTQMRQRTKWGNVVAMYKGIRPLVNYGYEQKPAGMTDFNMFMRANLKITDIYLTKAEMAGGGCIAAPYQLTQGSLPTIVTTGSGDNVRTDIKLGDLVISAETTVREFANAVVMNNADYDYGDQISFFDVVQRVNAETLIPYCQFFGTNVMLDKASEVKLLDMVSPYGFATVDGYLGHIEGEGNGCFGWVHSRMGSGKTLVSTQVLVNNNSDMIADYSGNQAYKRSVKTYGGETSAFLTPGSTTTSSAGNSSTQLPSDDNGDGSDGGSGGSGNDNTDNTGGSGGSGSGGGSDSGSDSGGGSGSDGGGDDVFVDGDEDSGV